MRPAVIAVAAALAPAQPALAEPLAPLPGYAQFAEAGDSAGLVNGLVRCAGLVRVFKARGLLAPDDDTDVRILDKAHESRVFMTAENRAAVDMDTAPYEGAYAEMLGAREGEAILALPTISQDMSACGTLIRNAG
jgi:hypothetical protein